MKRNRFWIEIVMLAAGMACALALLLACLVTVGAATGESQPAQEGSADSAQPNPPTYGVQQDTQQSAQHEVQNEDRQEVPQQSRQQTSPSVPAAHQALEKAYEGMVTCAHCGARHAPASGKTAADCSRACVFSGSHFTLVEGDKAYLLEGDVVAVKKFAGQRARIVGTLHGNTIIVSSAGAVT